MANPHDPASSGVTVAQVPIGALRAEQADKARKTLRTRFRFVEVLETLEQHCTVLRAIIDVPLHALPRPTGLDGQVDRDLTIAKSRFDIAFYDRAQAAVRRGIDLA